MKTSDRVRAWKQPLRELAIVRCFLSDINCKNVILLAGRRRHRAPLLSFLPILSE